MLARALDDKLLAAVLFTVWGGIVLLSFGFAGILSSKFVGFGPGPHVRMLDYPIDTWPRWWLVVAFTVLDTCQCMWEFAHDAIVPWTFNVLADPKSTVLPYSKPMCLLVVEGYILHSVIMGAFGLFVSLAQLDFVIIRGAARMAARGWTHWRFMEGKSVETGYTAPAI